MDLEESLLGVMWLSILAFTRVQAVEFDGCATSFNAPTADAWWRHNRQKQQLKRKFCL
jgi:hypothetical protein